MSVESAFKALDGYDRLTKRSFDAIVHRHDVDPNDEDLVSLLIDAGWVYTPYAEEDWEYAYIRVFPEVLSWNRLTAVLGEVA